MKACLVLLLALSAAAVVSARVFHEDGARSLLQTANALCPEGCDLDNGGCVQDATTAGLRCQDCLGTLLVNKINGNCSCPAGKYASAANTCTDCPKGSYCGGGDYSYDGSVYYPVLEACPANMTTVGRRSISNRACVNLPGFYYTISSDGLTVAAVQCPEDTYSAGFKKQRACVPCPTGFTTNGVVGATSPTQCLVPAGYYLKAPGQVAPCPKGEYKELFGPSANCTKCAFGVTTVGEGSTSVDNCTILMPGYYAQAMSGAIVTRTVICPQGYYCPGGIPSVAFNPLAPGTGDALTILKCDGDAWTVEVGAQTAEQCMVPPGFYFDGTTTVQCAAGSYRADWKTTTQATECISCGTDVRAATTDQVKQYNITDALITTMVPVTSSSDDCYIMPGQGLYYSSTTFTWRARNCSSDNYGVANITYGLSPAPCKDCPANMVASSDSSDYPTSAGFFVASTDSFGAYSGFTSVKACVTQAGYGYNGRIAQKCDRGSYNDKDNYNGCTKCAYGYTTSDVGLGYTISDCGLAAGFGLDGGVVRECPIGTYNAAAYTATPTACTNCSAGTTTQGTGSNDADQCNLCLPGFGGVACNVTCGGVTSPGTYGPPGRSPTDPDNMECVACSTQTTGYSFEWNLQNDIYAVPAISKEGATASTDCLSKYAQVFDGAWYLPTTPSNTTTTTGVTTFGDCVDACTAATNCQYLTYDYQAETCSIKEAATQRLVGAPVVGFKAVPSGDVGTSSWSLKSKANKLAGKAVASGQYTFYQDPTALEIGNWTDAQGRTGQKQPTDASSFTKWQDCLNACDDDVACAAFIIQLTVDLDDRPRSCILVYGRTDVGVFKRSMTRADIDRLSDPSGNLR